MYQLIKTLGFFFVLFLCSNLRLAGAAVIEIPGKGLPDLLGKNSAQIRLYANDGSGGIRAIPFQIDTAANGFSVLAFGKDFGLRVDPGKWPAAVLRYEVSADAAGTRVAYLTWEDSPASLAAQGHLSYDTLLDQIDSDFYQSGFVKNAPLIQDRLVIKTAPSPVDILDRFKVRLNLAIKNFFDFKIDEGEISSQILKVDSGPIRIHRQVQASKKIGPIKLMPKSRIDFYFYPGWVEVVSQIINPVDGPKVLEDKTSGATGYDLNAAAQGSTFRSSSGASLLLDGKPEPAEADLSKNKLSWWSIAGPSGTMLVRVVNDPKLASLGIEPSFILNDDLTRSEKPETENGGIFLGFNLPYHRIPKGEYSVRVTQVFPKTMNPGEEAAALAEARVVAPSEVRKLP